MINGKKMCEDSGTEALEKYGVEESKKELSKREEMSLSGSSQLEEGSSMREKGWRTECQAC